LVISLQIIAIFFITWLAQGGCKGRESRGWDPKKMVAWNVEGFF
jgi:hypothetical protein